MSRRVARMYAPLARPLVVRVEGRALRAAYTAHTVIEALALVGALRRGWPHARVYLTRPAPTAGARGRVA